MKSPMLHHRKIPSLEEFDKFSAESKVLVDVMKELGSDFSRALHEVAEKGDQYRCRALVRCFGSMLEGLTMTMREIACGMCELFGKPLNPFLREKSGERGVSSSHRIFTIYRLLAEFAPESPLANIPDERWDKLHAAIAIRNRITHPGSVEDLELTQDDLNLIVRLGNEFLKDVPAFGYWCGQTHQRFMWSLGGQRVRKVAKVGRNDLCPCGSKKKYKACCGASAA
jgi:hypothetical protein